MADPLSLSLTRMHNYGQRVCGTQRAEIIWERWASYNSGDEERIWTEVRLATRFLTSVLNPLVNLQLGDGLGSVGLHVVREKHIAAALADFDSCECVVVGKEGPGSKAAWVLRSS